VRRHPGPLPCPLPLCFSDPNNLFSWRARGGCSLCPKVPVPFISILFSPLFDPFPFLFVDGHSSRITPSLLCSFPLALHFDPASIFVCVVLQKTPLGGSRLAPVVNFPPPLDLSFVVFPPPPLTFRANFPFQEHVYLLLSSFSHPNNHFCPCCNSGLTSPACPPFFFSRPPLRPPES